jgi:hypothetical protein
MNRVTHIYFKGSILEGGRPCCNEAQQASNSSRWISAHATASRS